MRHFRFLSGVLIIASTTLACSESSSSLASSTPTSPSGSASALTGEMIAGTWQLVSLQNSGQSEQATPGGANYTLRLENGRLSAQADCNVCSGAFSVTGLTLTAGPALACTRAACATMAFESDYTRLLSGDSAVMLAGGSLTLTSARGTLRFAR